MNLFYMPELAGKPGEKILLSPEESRHCVSVLRMKNGSVIHIVNGKGGLFKAEIITPDPKKCEVELLEVNEEFGKRDLYLHIAVAPTKNSDRTEWMLEKITEIGFDELTLLQCEHSERKSANVERLEKVAVSAMKQSLKAWLPKINGVVKFNDFVNREFDDTHKMVAWCEAPVASHLAVQEIPSRKVLILIGPEGDFSPAEAENCKKAGFVPVSLGENRLRTETAGVVACTILNTLNDINSLNLDK